MDAEFVDLDRQVDLKGWNKLQISESFNNINFPKLWFELSWYFLMCLIGYKGLDYVF